MWFYYCLFFNVSYYFCYLFVFYEANDQLKKNIYFEKNVPVQEVSEAVDAALRHSGAQTSVDGGRTLQIGLQPLKHDKHTDGTIVTHLEPLKTTSFTRQTGERQTEMI